jgi:hypothetical protein
MRTDGEGRFKSGSLDPGLYFVVVKDPDPTIAFPIRLEKQYDGKTCSLHTVFTFDRATKKTEQTVTIIVNSIK